MWCACSWHSLNHYRRDWLIIVIYFCKACQCLHYIHFYKVCLSKDAQYFVYRVLKTMSLRYCRAKICWYFLNCTIVLHILQWYIMVTLQKPQKCLERVEWKSVFTEIKQWAIELHVTYEMCENLYLCSCQLIWMALNKLPKTGSHARHAWIILFSVSYKQQIKRESSIVHAFLLGCLPASKIQQQTASQSEFPFQF